MVMRVMFTAQDPQTIRDAFAQAKPNTEYARLYAAAVARRQADQIYNLSLTRTATVTLARGRAHRASAWGGSKPRLSPSSASASWRSGQLRPAGLFRGGRHGPGRSRPVPDAPRAEGAHPQARATRWRSPPPPRASKGRSRCGSRTSGKDRRGCTICRRCRSCAAPASAGRRRERWRSRRSSTTAQGKKVITYPRAETRYLPESLIPDVPRIVAGTARRPSLQRHPCARERRSSAVARAAFSMTRASPGPATMPSSPTSTRSTVCADIWPRLSADERRLFDVIARAYLAAMMPDFRYRQTTVTLDVQGHQFGATGRQPLESGLARGLPGLAAGR